MMGAVEVSARATFDPAIARVRWRRLDRLGRMPWRRLPIWSPLTASSRRFPNCETSGGRVERSRAARKMPNKAHDKVGGAR
jgi:hypothetical protein